MKIMSISTLGQDFRKAHSDQDNKKCDEIASAIVSTPASTIDEMLDKIFAAYWLAGLKPQELHDYEAALANKIADVRNIAGDLLQGHFRGLS
jgi:hypothetical protein